MHVRVELYGRAASQSGERELELELSPGATLSDAAIAVTERLPVLAWMRQICRPARNLEYSTWDTPLADGDEVSFIPPVSGGSDADPAPHPVQVLAEILDTPLDPGPLVAFCETPEMGAVVTFSGNVRNYNRGRTVGHLEYEGYRPMAVKEMRAIAEEAAQRWNARVAVQHRLGRLEIGEASVLVVAASAHRGDAFEACRYTIDTLKERVPIWKREVWEEGDVWIEGPGEATVQSRA